MTKWEEVKERASKIKTITKNIYMCGYCKKEYQDQSSCIYCEDECRTKSYLLKKVGSLSDRVETLKKDCSPLEEINLLKNVESKEQLMAYLKLKCEDMYDCSDYTIEDFVYPCNIVLRLEEDYDSYSRYPSNNFYLSPVKEFLEQHYGSKAIELIRDYLFPQRKGDGVTRFKTIVICGSSRFKYEFQQITKDMTLKGVIAIPLNIYTKSDKITLNKEKKDLLMKMQLQKIADSDGIFVINKGGYIGENTKREIEYAESLGKNIEYLE